MPASYARPVLQELRRRIEKIEKSSGVGPERRLGEACLLGPLQIAPGALHEIRIEEWRDAPAAYGLAHAIAGAIKAQTGKPAYWISEGRAGCSLGRPYGCGLVGFGVDPAQFVVIHPRNIEEALWATEEVVNAPGVGVVFAEFLKSHRRLDLTATRRLQLAAENSGVAPVLLRSVADQEASAARTRWLIAPAPSAPNIYDLKASGNSRWRVQLEKSRDGGRGVWLLEWNDEARELREAALHGRAFSKMADRPSEKAQAVA